MIAFMSFGFNFLEWNVKRDFPDYYLAGKKNGFWCCFWLFIGVLSV